jgi:hypothetical protein
MADTGNAVPPGNIEAKGISNAFAKDKSPEGHNENRVENQCQHGTPADFDKPGLGLGKIAGPDRPFPKEYGNKRIAVESNENKANHSALGKMLCEGDFLECPRIHQFVKVALTQKIKPKPKNPVKENMDHKPYDNQIHNGKDNPPSRLWDILERPVPAEHMLPDPHQNHHGKVHDKGVRKRAHRPPWIAENKPYDPCYQKKYNK